MATKILEIANTPFDVDDDDDDISYLYTTSGGGSTKADAKITIDISDDDEVEILHSTGKRRRFYKGECSNSKKPQRDKDKTVLRHSFLCEICTDEKPNSDSFKINGCRHSYCSQCVSNYVAAKLHDNVIRINCPVPRCRGLLEPPHCRTILPKAVFERWGDALCEAMILGAEKFYCPYKDCSALLIDDHDKTVLHSECPECNRLFCVPCKVPWHAEITCSEFRQLAADERSNDDIMLMKLAEKKGWARCPKCRFYVSKSGGCSQMRCRCRTTFSYTAAKGRISMFR